jgi:large subunit ribosomal protein L7/L12
VDETAAEPASTIKTSFTVRLVKYDETKKIAIIKEVKNLVPGLNLVQAKKFVESLPQIIKEDASNDEADQLKKKLAEIGAIVEIA